MIMAEQLGGFVDLMGGYAQAAVLVDILGSLATVEETIVRDKVSPQTLGGILMMYYCGRCFVHGSCAWAKAC